VDDLQEEEAEEGRASGGSGGHGEEWLKSLDSWQSQADDMD